MNTITAFLIRFSIFWIMNSVLDVYLFDKPINHLVNISIALTVASLFTILDYVAERRRSN